MSRSSVLLSMILAVIIVSLGAYAWHLHRRLAATETALYARGKKDLRPTPYPAESTFSSPASESAPANEAPPTPSNLRSSDSSSAYTTPEGRRLVLLQYKGGLDRPYAVLFKQLNLAPADLEKLKSLLAERKMAEQFPDVLESAAGLNPRDDREQIQKLGNERVAETDASIRALLGETGYQRYRQYDQTQSQRSWVNRLEQQLSFSGAPLYGNQSEQLVGVLATTAPDQSLANIDSIATQSAGFLSPPQVDAFRQLLQDEAAQSELVRQIQQARRAALGASEPIPPGASAAR